MAKRHKKVIYDDYFRDDMHTCMNWCLKNGIIIWTEADSINTSENKHRPNHIPTGEMTIFIDQDGMKIRSPKKYKPKEVYAKIWELYCHYYDTKK